LAFLTFLKVYPPHLGGQAWRDTVLKVTVLRLKLPGIFPKIPVAPFTKPKTAAGRGKDFEKR